MVDVQFVKQLALVMREMGLSTIEVGEGPTKITLHGGAQRAPQETLQEAVDEWKTGHVPADLSAGDPLSDPATFLHGTPSFRRAQRH